ncbi:MAG TPA: DUF305 domain-containing protein [Ignavibacteria bacterium]|nr:DUF305 domain-containing protein [Ignavibacteria bacterium]
MVDTFTNVYSNLNQVYMAGLMTASMIIIEILLMRTMYKNKRWNLIILVFSVFLLAGCFLFIRQQTAIGDKQFLRSMIPHHAGAILMCDKSSIQDPEIQELCRQIKISQEAEIEQMKAILNRLDQ